MTKKANSLDGDRHETIHHETRLQGASDRGFGLFFAAICGIIAGFVVWRGRPSGLWWSIAALAFLAVAVIAPPLLGPANRAWRRHSLRFFELINPLVMAILFFGVLMPIGIIMRLSGKDPLRLRFEPGAPSYWLSRDHAPGARQTAMTRQF